MVVVNLHSGTVTGKQLQQSKLVSKAALDMFDEYATKRGASIRDTLGGGHNSRSHGGSVLHTIYLTVRGGVRPLSMAELFLFAEKCGEDPFKFLAKAAKKAGVM